MKAEIEKFVYGGSEVEFDLTGSEIMINATEMGKIFGKRSVDFLKIDQTKEFILAISESEDIHSEKVVKVVNGGKNSGTWMHRKLALKFAAWLNPRFELWVFDVIEKIMFGDTAKIKSNHEQLQVIIERIKDIDATASVIMKERYQLVKQKESIEIENFNALGLVKNLN
jgi:hypothetical protein